MSCVEKRHVSHRMGSMLHHRFPNGFTDLFMDETDREVSTLTDRAFRSLCVGDDAVYNDEFLYGYSPFSCHKPLVGEPVKKNHHHKESKKQQGQNKNEKNVTQPWKQQQQKNISSFLKALSATEGSCEGMLIKNGGSTDSNGESWDKSALRSIQRELSEFSSEYHSGLTDHHHNNHHSADGASNKKGKDAGFPSGKSTKIKNGKSTVKIRKLNIKNFFLHSEFSPFQSWTDLNRFPFGQKDTSILPTDNVPKWYDLPFYKELTEVHKKESLHVEEEQSCQKAVEPSPPVAPKPVPPPRPPKVLPKHSVTPAEKRCSSMDGGDGNAAPWRRNRSRAKSAIPVNQAGIQPHDNSSKILEETVLQVKEARSVEVKAIEEVSSLASTPFSICQLMTPLIPSRQPTETSEILQGVLSPSALELPLRPQSEAKGTPEPPVKRESYKSLASSILFNLKDNRKRVKSRYSPPKFKTLELPGDDAQSPQSDNARHSQPGTDGNVSGLSTPAIQRDGLTLSSPTGEPVMSPFITKHETDRPLSEDYLLSNLLQTNSLGEENPISPFINSKKNKSPVAKKQSYPSLNLYKKASPVDGDMKYLQVPLSADISEVSPVTLNKELLPIDTGFSPNTLNVIKDRSPIISPHTMEKEMLPTVGKRPSNVPEKTKWPVKDSGVQPTPKEKETGGQSMRTKDVIRAAREAINAAKSRALSGSHSESSNKAETEVRLKEKDEKVSVESMKKESSAAENKVLSQSNKSTIKKEPPPVPKRTFAKSDLQLPLDKTHEVNKISNGDSADTKLTLPTKEKEFVQKQSKLKHIFSARQNNYIKHQRYAVTDDEHAEECEEGNPNVNKRDDEMSAKEMKDSEHIISDLQALKELEKAKLGDRVLENAMSKLGEEAKAKNDLISRELKNIKKGMLSMRGNTSAKREIFSKQEKEQSKQTAFTKLDSNVIVNKALLNDNYDKAKMALEEIITEREKRKNKTTEQDANQTSEENVTDESYTVRVEQLKRATKDPTTEAREKQNSKEADLQERLGDLRDHNHLRQILSLTEPRLGETHRSGGRVALPGMDKIANQLNTMLKTKDKPVNNKPSDNISNVSDNSDRQISRQVSEDSAEYMMNENEARKLDAPPVPPRSKKGGSRGDGSVTKEQDLTAEKEENAGLNKIRTDLDKQDADVGHSKAVSYKERCTAAETVKCEPSENTLWLSPEFNEDNLQLKMSHTREATSQNSNAQAQETCKVKRKAPLKPEHLITPAAEDKTNRASDDVDEVPRNMISPLLLVNGVSINQSPPDQASPSSKSSYFSAESALLRNTETESCVYHSLENLIGEVEEVIEVEQLHSNSKQDSDRTEVEYYSLSDHESEPEVSKRPIKSPPQEACKDDKQRENASNDQTQDENSSTTMLPSNTFSPTLGIPALFKVKDNTFSNKLRKAVQPWSPRGSLNGSEKEEDEICQVKENPELPPVHETPTSASTLIPAEVFQPEEIVSNPSPPLLFSPSNCTSPKKPEVGAFLTVPQEEDRSSGISPCSGVESLTASTTDEISTNTAGLVEHEATKALSEHSGSTCSANESQTGLPKPPAVLPKSEKAVLKAIKLANRRIKKEEAQKTSQSSSKHRADRHKSEKSEHKSSSSSSKKAERKHKSVDRHNDGHPSKNSNKQSEQQLSSNEDHQSRTEGHRKTRRQSHDSAVSSYQNREASDRQGRSNDRHVRDKPESRHYSSDRVISNVPVYKAHLNERPMSDRPFQRSQSIDRYLGDKVERRLSADMSEKLDSRAQRIEKSIMDELQQRGRARDKAGRENPVRRSHSTEASHPSPLSRQSSITSQLSRQSSIEHAIVTQSFSITQRKLLQDPDSGQYFFVDMPVQVKTKTFFDPETGSYVQLPVQPPDGTVPQASPMEVLTPPMVLYHGFVPVPLSPMAQKATIPVPHMEPDEFEQRHLERSRQMHCKEGHPYLEPLYGQHDHMLGEFMGTEELDCPS